jgi:hypothetical protein
MRISLRSGVLPAGLRSPAARCAGADFRVGLLAAFGVVAAVGLGCGGGEQSTDVAARKIPSIAGTWHVTGTTVEKDTGQSRAISGHLIMAQEGDRFTATFDLTTDYPTPEGPTQADVIGKGEGQVQGASLEGRSEIQLVIGTVPGVDVGFAYVPRITSTRLVNTMKGQIQDDGTIVVESENVAAEGETGYRPTRTTLRGSRAPESPEHPAEEPAEEG